LGLVQALLGAAFTAAGGPIAVDGPFNGPVGPRRSLGTVALPMGAIQRLKRRTGGSVDDVVLALVGMGLSRYLRDVAFEPTPRALRAMVPVSTRAHLRGVRLGNHVSSVFIDLPMEGDDFAARVRTVAASKATLRGAHAAAGSALMVEAAGLLPGPLHGAVVRFAMDLPFANLVVSDVPGPDAPMYMLGRRIEAVYPMLPLARDIGLTIATLSVGGVMGVGVTADPDLVPDAQRIAKAIKDALSRSFAQHLEPVEDHIEPELERV
jgi:WS/DGAT/MGAT family acyltransferase